MTWEKRELRRLNLRLSRAFATIAALCVLYCEITSSSANKMLLLGVKTPPAPTIAYRNSYILPFLSTLLNPSSSIESNFNQLLPWNASAVLYLDIDETTPILSTTKCKTDTDIDYIYIPTYLESVLQRALAGYHWNLTQHWIVVDCSYDGRMIGDTTVLKAFLIDREVQTFTTFMVQILSITRPKKERRTSGGAAMFTTTHFSSLYLDGSSVASNQDAVYNVSMGFTFPYEWDDFEPVVLSSLLPSNGQWYAQVVSTKENFLFAGTTGIYRRSPEIQGSFNYFYWDLPPNPIEFASVLQFVGVKVFKDSWGWFRCFLGLGISSNIIVNTVVSLLVMFNMWRNYRVFWVPDVFPSIQSRAFIRASLLLLDCIMNSWWYPYQWAINQGSVRNRWGGTVDFNEISRADGLMVCLAVTYYIATKLCVRVQLIVVVLNYALCYYCRQSLIKSCGIFLTSVTPFIKKNYFDNILPTGSGAMDLWAYHENFTNNFSLIANECTYLIVASGVNICYVVILKLWETRLQKHSRSLMSTVRFLRWHHVKPIVKYLVKRNGTGNSISKTHRHWNVRSTLYVELNQDDIENSNIERCAGCIVSRINGFVAFTNDYVYDSGEILVSASGIWLLGYVIINDQYVVQINHYLFLAINSVWGRTYFKVYGFELKGDVVSTRKHRILATDIIRSNVWRVSLRKLR